jgi:hypothetical protein
MLDPPPTRWFFIFIFVYMPRRRHWSLVRPPAQALRLYGSPTHPNL